MRRSRYSRCRVRSEPLPAVPVEPSVEEEEEFSVSINISMRIGDRFIATVHKHPEKIEELLTEGGSLGEYLRYLRDECMSIP